MKNRLFLLACVLMSAGLFMGCQKMKKPELGTYPTDANPSNGPLKFYAAFDGSSTNTLMNAVDSIKANFPADNPLASTDGIRGKGIQGAAKKFIKYGNLNGWAGSSSMSVSVWFKKNGQTTNNLGGNGPEYILSMRAQGGFHWSDAVYFLFLEGNNTACAVKSEVVANNGDTWFTWEGGNSIAGLCNNQWHHLVWVYDETNSSCKLYIDGVQNPNVGTWGGHGALNLATSKVTENRIGRGPRNDSDGDGEGGWLQSSFKGQMDQVRLYGKALTQAEISALFNGKM